MVMQLGLRLGGGVQKPPVVPGPSLDLLSSIAFCIATSFCCFRVFCSGKTDRVRYIGIMYIVNTPQPGDERMYFDKLQWKKDRHVEPNLSSSSLFFVCKHDIYFVHGNTLRMSSPPAPSFFLQHSLGGVFFLVFLRAM